MDGWSLAKRNANICLAFSRKFELLSAQHDMIICENVTSIENKDCGSVNRLILGNSDRPTIQPNKGTYRS